jgi:hypothetical protein
MQPNIEFYRRQQIQSKNKSIACRLSNSFETFGAGALADSEPLKNLE